MKVALHFDADAHGGYYGPPIDELVFRALVERVPPQRRHLRLYWGDLIVWAYAQTAGGGDAVIRRLLDVPTWQTVEREAFVDACATKRIYIGAVEGLTRTLAADVDAGLRGNSSYLGAIEITSADAAHWVMYDQSLIPRYRIVGTELRMFYAKDQFEAGGDRDDGLFSHWQELRLFETVAWEDIGLRGSIFDDHDTLDNARRLAELDGLLSAQMESVVNEVLIRTRDLDPILPDALHAALHGFDFYESSEQLAMVAVACRRFIERLANVLFPARGETYKERDVGPRHYRNRLWAYIDDTLSGSARDVVLASLQDVGTRLDKLDALANKGVHAAEIAPAEVQRLLVGLVTFTYDVLTATPPPTTARSEPYEEAVRRFVDEIRTQQRGDQDG